MSIISTSVSSALKSSGASSGDDISGQISRIMQQIKQLSQQLKNLANSSGSGSSSSSSSQDVEKQVETIQSEIEMLQAQLAQLEQKQAEKALQGKGQSQDQIQAIQKQEGVNSPSATNKVDIYV